MFEQSLYEQNTASKPSHEGELFRHYEIKNWELSPRLYKILAVSAIANILALLIVAQTSLLTLKGCDSPLVANVCQALDTVYIGALLFGTPRDYVDVAYDKTSLADADITFVDVGGANAPLTYPDGYFQIANPNEYAMLQQQTNASSMLSGFPGIPNDIPITKPSTGNSLFDTKPVLPKPKTNVVDGDLPTINDSGTSSTFPLNRRRNGNGKITTSPKNANDGVNGQSNQVANSGNANADPNKKVDPTNPVNPIDINKRPFVDLANNVNDLLDKKEVRLETAFVVNANGKLTKEGKLDPKSFRWGQVTSSDQKMIEVVKEAVEAINDSGYLGYLKDLSGKDFNLTLQQDDTNISAVVQSEMESDKRANSIRSALTLVMDLAKSRKMGANADQNDKDDLILLQNAKVETEGKKVILKFVVPKEIALPMIQRKLAEQKAQPKQPSGITANKPDNNSAQK